MLPAETHAAVLSEPRGEVSVREVPLDPPAPGHVVLRMEACSLCHSDLFVRSLEKLPLLPLTLGHEGIGRVEALGVNVADWKIGDRAGVTFLGTICGACEWCSTGRRRFCPKQTNFGYTLQGALGDFITAPAAGLVQVPDELSAEIAAPLCCAGLTACGALREAGLTAGQSVALFGFGGLGHLAFQLARHRGLRVAVSDPSAEKMELARADGAESEARNMDAAIVFTGAPAAIPQAFRSLKRNGTLVLAGLSANSYQLPLVDTVLKGITIRGSYLGSADDLREVFDLALQGILRPHIHTHALDEVPALLDRMSRSDFPGRAVIAF